MASKPSSALGGLKRSIERRAEFAADYARGGAVTAPNPTDSGLIHRANQVGTVIQVGVIGLAILIIILVYSQVNDSLPTPSNTDLANAQTNATDTFAQAMELAPVIMIVLLAAVVIAVVQRFRS